MARLFDGVDDLIAANVTQTSLITVSDGTMVCWAKPTGTPPTNGDIRFGGQLMGTQTAGSVCGLVRVISGGNDRVWAYNFDGTVDSVGVAYTNDVWAHFGWTHTGGNIEVWKDGASGGTVASGNSSLTSHQFGFGKNTTANFYTGDLAECATWSVALTAAEMASLGAGVSPLLIRPASLTGYWPLWGRHSPEINWKSATTATLTGTAEAAHPLILNPWSPRVGLGFSPPVFLSGQIDGLATVAGALLITRLLSGASAGVTTLTGALALVGTLLGAVAGTATVTGLLRVERLLQAEAAGGTTLIGVLELRRLLAGAVGGVATLTGLLSTFAVFPTPTDPHALWFFIQRGNVWRYSETRNGGGAVTGTGKLWQVTAGSVPLYLEASPSQSELQAFIQAEGDNVFTLDKLHFPIDADVRAGDVVEITSGHAKILGHWMLRGDLRPHTWWADKQVFVAARLAIPPEGVS